jgi:hypothetical protein
MLTINLRPVNLILVETGMSSCDVIPARADLAYMHTNEQITAGINIKPTICSSDVSSPRNI